MLIMEKKFRTGSLSMSICIVHAIDGQTMCKPLYGQTVSVKICTPERELALRYSRPPTPSI